jgi:hypothetical protein
MASHSKREISGSPPNDCLTDHPDGSDIGMQCELERIEELADALMSNHASSNVVLTKGAAGKYFGTLVPSPAHA